MNALKVKILSLVLFVLLPICLVFSQPKAVIHPMEYDFGEIIEDSVVTKNFVITNKGSELLKITDIKASCGCTAVVAGKNELKPGDSTDIKVSFNSEGKSGKQTKTVTVKTNDPVNTVIRLAFTGNVVKKDLKIGKIEKLKD